MALTGGALLFGAWELCSPPLRLRGAERRAVGLTPKWAIMARLMQKGRLKPPQKSLILENQAIWVISASHFRAKVPVWTRRNKSHLGAPLGVLLVWILYQRDRATFIIR